MKLTPLGYGRAYTVCGNPENCKHSVVRHGDHWAHCEFAEPRLELNQEFLNGPESNCRANLWGGVKEIPVPTIAAQQREGAVAKQAESAVALLKAFGAVPPKEEDICAGIEALAAAGHLSTDVAIRVEATLVAAMGVKARA